MNKHFTCLLIVFCVFFALSGHSEMLHDQKITPSFDCERASSKVEEELCSESEYAALDIYLDYVYELALESAGDKNALRNEQRRWLAGRDECIASSEFKNHMVYNEYSDCYGSRIREIVQKHEVRRDKAFYRALANKLGISVRESFANAGEEFVYHENLSSHINGVFDGFCSHVPLQAVFYSNPVLVVHYYGSTVCGGTSHVVVGNDYYCKTERGFRKRSVWDCISDESLNVEDTLFGYLTDNPFQEFVSRGSDSEINGVIQFLYWFPVHGLSEPDARIQRRRIFSPEYINIAYENRDFFYNFFDGYEKELLDIADGMKCTLGIITSTDGWEETLGRSRGWGRADNWFGRQFNGCDHLDERIPGQAYTYKEFYVLMWRQLYANNSFEKAKSLLPSVRDEIQAKINLK